VRVSHTDVNVSMTGSDIQGMATPALLKIHWNWILRALTQDPPAVLATVSAGHTGACANQGSLRVLVEMNVKKKHLLPSLLPESSKSYTK